MDRRMSKEKRNKVTLPKLFNNRYLMKLLVTFITKNLQEKKCLHGNTIKKEFKINNLNTIPFFGD